MILDVPELSLVVLIGASGSGKSTFARRHFKPTEVMSSDFCRGLVSDDENSQDATGDWNAVLGLVRGSYVHTFYTDAVKTPLPAGVESIFAIHRDVSPFLEVGLGGLTLNCHFFGDDEIEFDLDPREVGEQTLAGLIGFLIAVGRVLRRNVFVTQENAREYPILVYEPSSDAVRQIRALADADREPERGA